MTPESKLRSQIKKYVDDLRKSGLRIKYLKLPGGPMMESGTPDTLIVFEGKAFLLESKVRPNKATAIQEQRISEWVAAGAVSVVVHSVEDVKAAIFCSQSTLAET